MPPPIPLSGAGAWYSAAASLDRRAVARIAAGSPRRPPRAMRRAIVACTSATNSCTTGVSRTRSSPPCRSPTGSASASASSTSATKVGTASSNLGRILVDRHGRTLYLFLKDKRGKSACSGACAAYWPPLIASGKPHAVTGAKQSLLGRTRRADGRMQITYRHHPLYRFSGDTRKGLTSGQGLDDFGGKWSAVSPRRQQDRDGRLRGSWLLGRSARRSRQKGAVGMAAAPTDSSNARKDCDHERASRRDVRPAPPRTRTQGQRWNRSGPLLEPSR